MATGARRYNAKQHAAPRKGKTAAYRNPLLRVLTAIGLLPARQVPIRHSARGKNRRRTSGNPERRFLHHLED